MAMTANTVHHEQVAELRGTGEAVHTRWTYSDEEPFAVTIAFRTESSRWVEWTFARDLLLEGLTCPSGLGDLRVAPGADEGSLLLEIRSPGGQAVFELDRYLVEDFAEETLDLVPEGTESERFDVDRLLAEISGA
jgi:hypothetical protein